MLNILRLNRKSCKYNTPFFVLLREDSLEDNEAKSARQLKNHRRKKHNAQHGKWTTSKPNTNWSLFKKTQSCFLDG